MFAVSSGNLGHGFGPAVPLPAQLTLKLAFIFRGMCHGAGDCLDNGAGYFAKCLQWSGPASLKVAP
jgi:hypothetical protein